MPTSSGWIEVAADHQNPRSPRLKLAYDRFGGPASGKKPLILLHGGPGEPVPVARILAGSEPGRVLLSRYDVLYFDQRGAGRSLTADERRLDQVVRHRKRYLMEQYVEDIEAIRVAVFGRDAKVTILGSSWGGYLGLGYALAHRDRVEALILGSFEATARTCGGVCASFDRTVLGAEVLVPGLRKLMQDLRRAVAEKRLVWHRGKKDARVLEASDLIELLLPFTVKARFQQLTATMQQLLAGDPRGQSMLDSLEMNETASAGGSLPGRATFCQELLVKPQLEALVAAPPPALYCDQAKIARAMLKICAPFFSERPPFDVELQLASLKVPALIFAGEWDPLIPWQSTARTAVRLGRASFALIDGGHTPFNEGGACLARALEGFAAQRYQVDVSCFRRTL